MLLTITNTKAPATDLGYLLHKNPNRLQSFDLSFGKAHVFYPEASTDRCTAALLLDVDPIGLVRTRRGPPGEDGMLRQYVNDRPYVASSFMSVAIARVFNSALAGSSKDRPALVSAPLPLMARIAVLPCRGGEEFVHRLFEPLGYRLIMEHHPLDEKFPEWGEGPYYTVEIAKEVSLQELLTHLYVLIPVLDAEKHYWVGQDEVEKLLRHGEGWLPSHPEREAIVSRYLRGIKFTELIGAVAFGSLIDVAAVVERGADLEERDYWERTPWLVAIQTGEIPKAKFLLEHGSDKRVRGRCGRLPLFYAIENGHVPMLRWLLESGTDIEQTDDFNHTALHTAVECCHDESVDILLAAGANVNQEIETGTALGNASTRSIAMKLMEAGADPQYLGGEARRAILGYPSEPDEDLLVASASEFQQNRSPRLGTQNPEIMNNPFWEGMIRSGIDAYQAGKRFGVGNKFDGKYTPIWCAQRFGQSLTFLPDGRIVQIAGEHEDGCDPDFCIYNDVFVHAPEGEVTIYCYPESVFPPTDFHTATLIGDKIYLIGTLGYQGTRQYGTTPVYRLDTTTFRERYVNHILS